ncbi:MAG: hypothetical protein NVS9B15_22800 [Acidobacteriaceae bacterium]
MVADCARELRDRGHRVSVLCEGFQGSPPVEDKDGIRLLRYQEIAAISPLRRRNNPIGTLLRREFDSPPDLIWGHAPLQFLAAANTFPQSAKSYVAHSPYSLEVLALHTRATIVDRAKAMVARQLERRCLKLARRVQVLSQFTRRELERLHGRVLAQKIAVTPGWCDTETFVPAANKQMLKERLGWQTQEPALLTLRRLVPRMGISDLISACAKVASQGHQFNLYVGGTGELADALQRQIIELKLEGTVMMLGELGEGQLRDAYAACDAFVIPTRALECFGLIAVEALSAGVPVLSTDVGALPEIVAEFEPAWITQPGTEGITKLLSLFLEGRLPQHSPLEIRSYAEQKYSTRTALRHFCDVALAG